jgi:hypothetical protein
MRNNKPEFASQIASVDSFAQPPALVNRNRVCKLLRLTPNRSLVIVTFTMTLTAATIRACCIHAHACPAADCF